MRGVAGVGGSILSPDETIEITYLWGLGHRTNNHVKAYALF